MNKTDLVKVIAKAAGLNQAKAKETLDATTAAIMDALAKGEGVQLAGFGTFVVLDKDERNGVNPATGEKITIAAKKVVKFKPGAALVEAVK